MFRKHRISVSMAVLAALLIAMFSVPAVSAQDEPIRIGMSVLNIANPFFVALVAGAQEEADKQGAELIVTDAQDDASRQVTDVENFIATGMDAIIVTAVSPESIAPIARGAIEAGIPVVAHTADLGTDNQTALVYAVERDMGLTLGRQIGDWANTHITDGELQIAILNYDLIPQVIQRREGIIEGIQETYSGAVNMVSTQTAGDPTTGLATAEIWLQQFPDLDVIAGINDGGALGAYQAVIAAGKDDPETFFVGGIDATDEAIAAIAAGGSYLASVDQQPQEMGALCVQVAMAALRGEPYEKVNAIVLSPVNASNLADFLPDPLLDEDFTDVTIGMSVLNIANPFFVALVAGAQEAAEKYGVELVVTDAQDDASRQVTDIENFIATDMDGIIVTAVSPESIAPIAKGAIEAGIPVVAHTADLGTDNQTALVYAVERDMGLTLGRQIGAWANDHITDGELQIAILNYDLIPQVIQRREGIIEGIEEVYDGTVTMVSTQTAGDPTTGLAAAEIWLQQFPDLDVIAGINDGGALGAYQAVIAAGKDDPETFFVGGIDATDEALAAIAAGGSYQASVDQQPNEMGALTVEVVLRALKGLPFELVNAIELSPVNATNYADFQ